MYLELLLSRIEKYGIVWYRLVSVKNIIGKVVMKSKILVLLLTSFIGSVLANEYGDRFVINVSHNGMPYQNDAYYQHGVQYYGESDDHDNDHYHDHRFLPSERYLRRQLYWLYKHNPHCLELANFPVDYFITILAEHAKVLECKIAEKRSGLASHAMFRGLVLSGFSSLWGYVGYDCYKKRASSEDPQGAVIATAIIGAVSALLGAIAGTEFDRVYRYNERLVIRLERDKRIITALERVKAVNGSNNTTSSLNWPLIASLFR
jgi:hypothetical protein